MPTPPSPDQRTPGPRVQGSGLRCTWLPPTCPNPVGCLPRQNVLVGPQDPALRVLIFRELQLELSAPSHLPVCLQTGTDSQASPPAAAAHFCPGGATARTLPPTLGHPDTQPRDRHLPAPGTQQWARVHHSLQTTVHTGPLPLSHARGPGRVRGAALGREESAPSTVLTSSHASTCPGSPQTARTCKPGRRGR